MCVGATTAGAATVDASAGSEPLALLVLVEAGASNSMGESGRVSDTVADASDHCLAVSLSSGTNHSNVDITVSTG